MTHPGEKRIVQYAKEQAENPDRLLQSMFVGLGNGYNPGNADSGHFRDCFMSVGAKKFYWFLEALFSE